MPGPLALPPLTESGYPFYETVAARMAEAQPPLPSPTPSRTRHPVGAAYWIKLLLRLSRHVAGSAGPARDFPSARLRNGAQDWRRQAPVRKDVEQETQIQPRPKI